MYRNHYLDDFGDMTVRSFINGFLITVVVLIILFVLLVFSIPLYIYPFYYYFGVFSDVFTYNFNPWPISLMLWFGTIYLTVLYFFGDVVLIKKELIN